DRLQGSLWRVELPGPSVAEVTRAVDVFLGCEQVLVSRLLKEGRREVDARAPIVSIAVSGVSPGPGEGECAILVMVVRQASPAVRPDDVLVALGQLTGLALLAPPVAVRMAQGPMDGSGVIG